MEELDLKETFQMLWGSKIFILFITIIFMVISLVYSYFIQKPMYQSYTTLVLTKVETAAQDTDDTTASTLTLDITMNQKLVSTYSEIVKSKNILNQVIENLKMDDIVQEELKKNITVEAVEDTEVIKIKVSDRNPENAAKIASEIGNVFSKKVEEIYEIKNIYILDAAEVAQEPYNIRPMRLLVIAGAVGFVLACAYVIIRNLFDSRIKSAAEIERTLNIPVIAQLPFYDDVSNRKVVGGK